MAYTGYDPPQHGETPSIVLLFWCGCFEKRPKGSAAPVLPRCPVHDEPVAEWAAIVDRKEYEDDLHRL